MEKIANRVAFVTGGARGIGRAICEQLGAQGLKIAIGYHSDPSRAEEVKQRIIELGGDAAIFRGSVDSYFDVRRVIDEVVEHFGCLNILVNNAGVTVDKTLRKMSVEEWKRVVQINLGGTFYTIKASLEYILESGWGRIVNISSIIALTGNVGQANYAAAKAGIIGLTKSLALELVNKNVTVNAD
jgi:NAD(P)-dependent dehydrogenase (short-subunit alcohol dehydrogenase family)